MKISQLNASIDTLKLRDYKVPTLRLVRLELDLSRLWDSDRLSHLRRTLNDRRERIPNISLYLCFLTFKN